MKNSLDKMIYTGLLLLATGYVSAGFLSEPRKLSVQNVDTTKFSSCIFDESNDSATCATADPKSKNTTTFHDVYRQCSGLESGEGTKIGTVPQAWGAPCVLWQNKPARKAPMAGSHRRN